MSNRLIQCTVCVCVCVCRSGAPRDIAIRPVVLLEEICVGWRIINRQQGLKKTNK